MVYTIDAETFLFVLIALPVVFYYIRSKTKVDMRKLDVAEQRLTAETINDPKVSYQSSMHELKLVLDVVVRALVLLKRRHQSFLDPEDIGFDEFDLILSTIPEPMDKEDFKAKLKEALERLTE